MSWYWKSTDDYVPVKAGSIDGTDTESHDHGIYKASNARYNPKTQLKLIKSIPYKTLFLGRLNHNTVEKTLQEHFSKYGTLKSVKIVRDIVTGASRGYAFIEFEHERDCNDAFQSSNRVFIDEKQILVDFEREQLMSGWIPRRMGGGLGGKKGSGQLRFGGRDRPFKKPIYTRRKYDEENYKEDYKKRDYSPDNKLLKKEEHREHDRHSRIKREENRDEDMKTEHQDKKDRHDHKHTHRHEDRHDRKRDREIKDEKTYERKRSRHDT